MLCFDRESEVEAVRVGARVRVGLYDQARRMTRLYLPYGCRLFI